MFGELPKLFDRDFAIGFFLPAALFLAVQAGLAHLLPAPASLLHEKDPAPLQDTALFALAALVAAVLLLALNYPVTRLLEGYGTLNPFRLQLGLERRRFRRLRRGLETLYDTLARTPEGPLRDALVRRHARLLSQAQRRFPHAEAYVLPTAFGNTMRGWEVYSTVLYGLDAIPGWNRLQAVIPADYAGRIGAAKAQADFWMNLWFLALVCLGEWLASALAAGLSGRDGLRLPPWLSLAALVVALVASEYAKEASAQWGDLVKSAFDLYRGDLRAKLGLKAPQNIAEEREQWDILADAWINRYPDQAARPDVDPMRPLDAFRDLPPPGASPPPSGTG